jgi:outer membrane usher protein FimD/PapC
MRYFVCSITHSRRRARRRSDRISHGKIARPSGEIPRRDLAHSPSTYANLSAWRSQSSALWSGNGANVSIGVNKTNWSASAYASLTRSSNQDTSNNSDSHSFNSGASFSVPLENWPDLTLAFDVGTYGGVYTTWDGKDNGRIVRGGVALDFSKYLIERPGQKLQLFYYARNESYDSQWGTLNSNYLTIDHVFGTVFRAWW